jgi:hypothetical protein
MERTQWKANPRGNRGYDRAFVDHRSFARHPVCSELLPAATLKEISIAAAERKKNRGSAIAAANKI